MQLRVSWELLIRVQWGECISLSPGKKGALRRWMVLLLFLWSIPFILSCQMGRDKRFLIKKIAEAQHPWKPWKARRTWLLGTPRTARWEWKHLSSQLRPGDVGCCDGDVRSVVLLVGLKVSKTTNLADLDLSKNCMVGQFIAATISGLFKSVFFQRFGVKCDQNWNSF